MWNEAETITDQIGQKIFLVHTIHTKINNIENKRSKITL